MSNKPVLTHSQVLERVKKMLPDGYTTDSEDNSPYICDNIQELSRQGYMTDETRDGLKRHISGLLEGRFCLKDWLYMKRIASTEDFKSDHANSWAKLQQTRKLWLEDMIMHFKSKGM